MRRPPTTEGEVWLHQYTSAFRRWATASGRDDTALAEAINALKILLERCPDYAAEVEQIASVACFSTRRRAHAEQIVRLAQIGLEAGAVASVEGAATTASAILLLSLAEAEFIAQRRLAGLDALRRLEERLSTMKGHPLSAWISGRMHSLYGELHELGLEAEQARRAYAGALEQIEPVLADATKKAALLEAWSEALGMQQTAVQDEVASLDLTTLATISAIGLARSVGEQSPSAERADAARRAWRALDTYGPPPDLSPFDIIPLIGSLPPEEAAKFGSAVVARIERHRRELERARVPKGITDPDAVAMIRRGAKSQAQLLQRQIAVYEVIGTLGVAMAHRAEGDLAKAEAKVIEAIRAAMSTRLGGPQVCALGLGFEISGARDPKKAAGLMDAFLMAFAGTMDTDAAFFASPRIRALLDGPVAAAARVALEQLGDGHDAPARRRASAILDLLRRQDLPPSSVLMPNQAVLRQEQSQDGAAIAAADTLGRVRVALTARPDTVALIIQSLGPQVAFVQLAGDDQPVEHFVAGTDYLEACSALVTAANDSLRAASSSRKKTESAVSAAGRRAFDALPLAVRDSIREHGTILIVPDFHARQDTVPFELMHDGSGYLAATKILARFTSIAHMASTLDTRVITPHRRRALVTAAPVVEGYDALDLAPLEQQEVTATLTQNGFDAPSIDPGRLSPTFFTDRLAYVDVLHVSAHGESAADLEWLVLPNGQRLVVEDLLENPQYRVPFVYLNTCNLGQTRYLGAGLSRGFAYSFAELGAPAVIANMSPVPDAAALRLAVGFYDNVPDRSVGEALRDARRALLESGEPVLACASAMLVGDPDHSIVAPRAREVADLASDVLDSYMTLEKDETRRVMAWTAAMDALEARENPRVEAAVAIIRTMMEVRDLSDPAQAAALDSVIGVADTLRHLPARAMLRFAKAMHAVEGQGPGEPAPLLEDAIRYLVPLAAFEPSWGQMLQAARQRLAVYRSAEKGLSIRSHVPAGMEDDGTMREIMEAVMGAQQAAAELYGVASVRHVENSVEDVLWNAVVTGHPNRFEDMPEAVAYARQVAGKLARRGVLPAASMEFARAMLVGMLRHLWDTQNLNYLSPDFAEGQAGTLRVLVDEIATEWSPPQGKPWYAVVEPAPRLVDEVLTFIGGLSWENVYKHLDKRMDTLAKQLQKLLAQVRKTHPAALGACAAYVNGVVMEKNTFSPLDGSVPEDIGARLTKVYHALAADNEARFFDYLSRGFAGVRDSSADELARWRMEPDRPPGTAEPSPLDKPAARPRRTRKRR